MVNSFFKKGENAMNLVSTLKDNNQDFEWYPTTNEIIKIISDDISDDNISILDIGAGDGSFFSILDSFKERCITKYAIEKSTILIENMHPDIFIIGTDFYEQTLIDKKVDIIFCNPPYSDYETWAIKILTESNCNCIYMVIPERWKDNKYIQSIIKQREIKYKIIGSTDFIDSEYRQARAKVDIIKFENEVYSKYNNSLESDPFDIWFDSFFNIKAEKTESSLYGREKEKKEQIKSELIKGQNIIEYLEVLYRKDFENLLNNYRAIEKLDFEIFKELGVDISNLKNGLKLKIEGLKNLYWNELFDNMKSITSRLTKKSREKLLDKLTSQTSIDFTIHNAYSVVIWAIKNANTYIDDQLKSVYLWMSCDENIINYKSNKKFIKDGWRYNNKDFNHYMLDYRLVFKGYNNFNSSTFGNYDYPMGLNKNTHDNINDIITISKNLGFNVNESSFDFEWLPGNAVVFTFDNETFMEIKAYKNGNIHCKPNQKFIKKLNIEAARLNGWIKSPESASEEMNISIEEIKEYYGSNVKLIKDNINLLILEDN